MLLIKVSKGGTTEWWLNNSQETLLPTNYVLMAKMSGKYFCTLYVCHQFVGD